MSRPRPPARGGSDFRASAIQVTIRRAERGTAVLILGIETSCDDSAAALVEDGRRILARAERGQNRHHAVFGGVVPEIASRRHLENLLPAVETVLTEAGVTGDAVDAVAVTNRPGLSGSLLVGVSAAKALALAWNKPVLGVDHLQAHLASLRLRDDPPAFPFLGLLVSGGHTRFYRVDGPLDARLLGGTIDDACGEAFDKVAQHLGLGFPGGPAVEAAARGGDEKAWVFPRPRIGASDVSYSGLKTAVVHQADRFRKKNGAGPADLAASFQRAALELLLDTAADLARREGLERCGVVGGVSANERFRSLAEERLGRPAFFPGPGLSTDNAAMVAAAGFFAAERRGLPSPDEGDALGVFSRSREPEVTP